MLFWTQGQYIFIHDVIKHKLESLGHGAQSPDDDDDEFSDADNVYASTLSFFFFFFF